MKKHLENYVSNNVENSIPDVVEEWVSEEKKAEIDLSCLKLPEIPSEEEIGWIVDGQVRVPRNSVHPNRVNEPFIGKNDYLSIQADLMRKDGVYPLQQSVDEFRLKPNMLESDSAADTRVYENVYIIGLTVAREGLALKIEFSTRRTGKLIHWAQSKRLKTGTMVALTPAKDNFRSKCIVAVVASRLLSALDVQYPAKPSIQIYIGNADQLEIDPQQEYVMVEAVSGYWEAYRHTFQALKKLYSESFPLFQHIVSLHQSVPPPDYRVLRPSMNLGSAVKDNGDPLYRQNVLTDWPSFASVDDPGTPVDAANGASKAQASSELDESQLRALQRILTRKLAIIQGPPGTGKTHVSVVAIKIMLENMLPTDPPIIVTAQTNHALDQLLRLISKFDPNFIRLGGQTNDMDIIKPRTLFEVKQHNKIKLPHTLKYAFSQRSGLERELERLLTPYISDQPLTPELCCQYGIISEQQRDSILDAESEFVGSFVDETPPMELWCDNTIAPAKKTHGHWSFGEFEEFEEFEKLGEEDLEAVATDDEKFETLRGKSFTFYAGYTSKQTTTTPDQVIEKQLQTHQDLNKVLKAYRPAMYDYFRRSITAKVTALLRNYGHDAQNLAKDLKIGKWEMENQILQRTKVIGLTTTGLSKYRGLITSLRPKVVLIEEAAETLEAYVAAACFESLEHLILVGDHQQLRGHCFNVDLEGDPANFDMSMFERLVKNGMPFTQLTSQRRMRPEIRELINPIYPELEDHSSVLDRPDIIGMGKVNMHFFHHKWHESNDDALSKMNDLEARMITAFFVYLVYNGLLPEQITVLTFYNGQAKLIRRLFKRHEFLQGHNTKVSTVDSYQGEENDIILLSLVRNNARNQIGFLSNINRACVSLSRARRGFYIFGNAGLLADTSEKWKDILSVLMKQSCIQSYLPTTCLRHGTVVRALLPTDFDNLYGGCQQACESLRSCGHGCQLPCHPFACDDMKCEEDCDVVMNCGHACSRGCGIKPCHCEPCSGGYRSPQAAQRQRQTATATAMPPPTGGAVVTTTTTTTAALSPAKIAEGKKKWAAFAAGGHRAADARAMADAEAETARRGEEEEEEAKEGAGERKTTASARTKMGALAAISKPQQQQQQQPACSAPNSMGDYPLIDLSDDAPARTSAGARHSACAAAAPAPALGETAWAAPPAVPALDSAEAFPALAAPRKPVHANVHADGNGNGRKKVWRSRYVVGLGEKR